jgi:hypothetical protein
VIFRVTILEQGESSPSLGIKVHYWPVPYLADTKKKLRLNLKIL